MQNSKAYPTLTVLYSPEDGCKDDSEEFCEILQKIVNNLNRHDHIVTAGAFNLRLRNSPMRPIRGSHGERTENGSLALKTDQTRSEYNLCCFIARR